MRPTTSPSPAAEPATAPARKGKKGLQWIILGGFIAMIIIVQLLSAIGIIPNVGKGFWIFLIVAFVVFGFLLNKEPKIKLAIGIAAAIFLIIVVFAGNGRKGSGGLNYIDAVDRTTIPPSYPSYAGNTAPTAPSPAPVQAQLPGDDLVWGSNTLIAGKRYYITENVLYYVFAVNPEDYGTAVHHYREGQEANVHWDLILIGTRLSKIDQSTFVNAPIGAQGRLYFEVEKDMSVIIDGHP